MKILMLSDINSVHTKKWIKALNKKGIDIFLFSLSSLKVDDYTDLNNFQYYCFGIGDQQGANYVKKTSYLRSIRKLKEIYNEFKPDIVHAHYASSYGLIGSALRHHPFVISIWGSDVFEFPQANVLNKFILKRNLKKADYLLSTSHVMAKETHLYISKEIKVIPFGVDRKLFAPKVVEQNEKIIIGTIKALETVYGIDVLLEAFKILLENYQLPREVELWIAGDGTRKSNLIEKSKKLNIDKLVVFKGQVPNEQVPELLSKIDITVIPSRSESFGVSAVESLLCETPVVASNVGGLPEIIDDGKTGLLAISENPKDLAEKIFDLISNEQKRAAFGKEGRNQMIQRYSWEQNVNEMVEFYEGLYTADNRARNKNKSAAKTS